MTNAMTPETLTALAAEISARAAVGYSIELVVGRKYVKIVKSLGASNRSVYGFVEVATGDLFKAATFNAPANGVRGNALAGDFRRCGPHGIG